MFLTLAIAGGEWPISRYGHLTPWEGTPVPVE